MDDFTASLLVFVSIIIVIILPRLRVNIGISILAGAIFLLFALGGNYIEAIASTFSLDTARIMLIVFFSLLLIYTMRESSLLDDMLSSIRSLLKSDERTFAVLPASIGLLPMPGGAYVSANIITPLKEKLGLNGDEATAINYWFRHVWEYSWPIYTGVIVAADIFNKDVGDFSLHMLFLTVVSIFFGYVFIYRRIFRKINKEYDGRNLMEVMKFIRSISPIAFVFVLTVLLGINFLLISLIIADSILLFYLIRKGKASKIPEILKLSAKPSILGIVFASLFMKNVVIATSAMQYTYSFFSRVGIPAVVVIILLPFLAGLMTGVTLAYVSITFPLLKAYPMTYPAIILAYASGYIGHLLSPVHLCLVLSSKHFNAKIGRVIRIITPSLVGVFVSSLLIYFLFQ